MTVPAGKSQVTIEFPPSSQPVSHDPVSSLMHPSDNELRKFLDESLDDNANVRVGQHLNECANCQRKVDSIVNEYRLAPQVAVADLDTAHSPSGTQRAGSSGSPVPESLQTSLETMQRFVFLGEIDRGGMGVVYRAFDRELKRDVAIKVSRGQDDPATESRFFREAQISAQLQHPGIVPVHQSGRLTDGRRYIAMKLVNGETLSSLIGDAGESQLTSRFFKIFGDICDTMAYAHSRDIVHRDLKPNNVMVGEFGEVQIMDWGLAKKISSADATGESKTHSRPPQARSGETVRNEAGQAGGLMNADFPGQTQLGQVFGTPGYMPPEQARGELTDKRSDVFALGGILYQVLTGRPPCSTLSSSRELARSFKHDPAGAQQVLEVAFDKLESMSVEPELKELAKQCLAADPDDRPADAHEVSRSFADYITGREERFTAATLERARSVERLVAQQKRNRQLLWFSSAIVCALVAASVVGYLYLTEKNSRIAEKARAQQEQLEVKLRHESRIRDSFASVARYQALASTRPSHQQHSDWSLALNELENAGTLITDQIDPELQTEFRNLEELVRVEAAAASRRQQHYQIEDECCNRLFELKENLFYMLDLRICMGKDLLPEYVSTFKRIGVQPGVLSHQAVERILHSEFHEQLVHGLLTWKREVNDRIHSADLEPDQFEEMRAQYDWLKTLIERADPDPYRSQVRRLDKPEDSDAVVDLTTDERAVSSLLTIHTVASGLNAVHVSKEDRFKFLLRAHQSYPEDFFVNWYLMVMPNVENYKKDLALTCYSMRPENPAVLMAVGSAFLKDRAPYRAIESLEKLMEIAPEYPFGLRKLAFAYQMAGELERAQRQHDLADIALENMRERFDALVGRYARTGQRPKAAGIAAYFTNCERREMPAQFKDASDEPLEPQPLNAATREQQKQLEQSITRKKKRIEEAPTIEARYGALGNEYEKLCNLLLDAGRPDLVETIIDRAIVDFEKTLELAENVSTPSEQLSRLCEQFGRLPVAIESIKRAIAIHPQYGPHYAKLETLYQSLCRQHLESNQPEVYQREVDRAIREMKTLSLSAPPDLATPYERLANFCQVNRRYADAAGAYEQASLILPAYKPHRQNLGLMYLRLGAQHRLHQRDEQADVALDSAIGIFENWAEEGGSGATPHERLAEAFELRGQPGKAMKSLKVAIGMHPDYLLHQQNYAKFSVALAAKTDDLPAAEKILVDSIGFLSGFETGNVAITDLYDVLADNYARQGQPEKALEALEHVVEQRPGDHPVRERLGRFYAAAGEAGKAEKVFLKLLEESRGSAHTTALLAQFYVDHGQTENAELLIRKAREAGITSETLVNILLFIEDGASEDGASD